jgi:hypothetical protein
MSAQPYAGLPERSRSFVAATEGNLKFMREPTASLILEQAEAISSLLNAREDETGWLVEEDAGGVIHWIALANFAWPLTKISKVGSQRDYDAERYMSPVQRVKDSNDALRFARKVDADAFIQLFDRFLLCPKATEHCWPMPAALNSDASTQTVGGE